MKKTVKTEVLVEAIESKIKILDDLQEKYKEDDSFRKYFQAKGNAYKEMLEEIKRL